jgi:hypothetical protein
MNKTDQHSFLDGLSRIHRELDEWADEKLATGALLSPSEDQSARKLGVLLREARERLAAMKQR